MSFHCHSIGLKLLALSHRRLNEKNIHFFIPLWQFFSIVSSPWWFSKWKQNHDSQKEKNKRKWKHIQCIDAIARKHELLKTQTVLSSTFYETRCFVFDSECSTVFLFLPNSTLFKWLMKKPNRLNKKTINIYWYRPVSSNSNSFDQKIKKKKKKVVCKYIQNSERVEKKCQQIADHLLA